MRRVILIVLAAAVLHGFDQAMPPAIAPSGVSNSASRFPPALPGGVLAPGDRITIDGVRLGASGIPQVLVRQGGSTLQATLLSASATQIQAVLPVRLRDGEAQVSVRSARGESRPAAVRIGQGAVGLFSRNSLGWGPAVATRHVHGRRQQLNAVHPASPGEAITLAATGGNSHQPLLVSVAGIQINGRTEPSSERGQTALTFVLPRSVPAGCYVPVYVSTGDLVSNTVTIPVSRNHAPCPAAEDWPHPALASGLLWIARFSMMLEGQPGDSETEDDEQAEATFLESGTGASVLPIHLIPPPGSCTVAAGALQAGSGPAALFGWPSATAHWRALDAGPEIVLAGPAGTLRLPRDSAGTYAIRHPKRQPRSLFPAGGYSISSAGGKDVGPFTALGLATASFTWTNRRMLGTIDRARGATFEWQGADPERPVLIIALSVDRATGASGVALCHAPSGSTSFPLPSAPLANLPQTRPTGGVPLSYVLLWQVPRGGHISFLARGINAGSALFLNGSGRSVIFR